MNEIKEIIFPKEQYDILIAHCRRKRAGDYLPGEDPAPKAYGLLAGRRRDDDGSSIVVARVFPLKRNVRKDKRYDEEMTRAMYAHGVPSKTPFEKRGWVADPRELFEIYRQAQEAGLELFGNYHMHVVPWPPDDPLRDTPTAIDTVLAKDSQMCVFIISLVDPARPIVRAFFESRPEQEIPVSFRESDDA